MIADERLNLVSHLTIDETAAVLRLLQSDSEDFVGPRRAIKQSWDLWARSGAHPNQLNGLTGVMNRRVVRSCLK